MVKDRPTRFLQYLVLAAAAVLPRLPAVPAAFSIDDPLLVEHASGSGGVVSAVLEGWPPGVYRPLVTLHFDVCHVLFGDWAPGYHMVSVLLHVVVVWLVFLLAKRAAGSGWPALYAVLGFALLPALTESVAWAASVGDLWATGLLIASVLLAVKATDSKTVVGQWLWGGSLATMIVAFSAREAALAGTILVPLGAWLLGRRHPSLKWAAAYPVVAIAYLAWYSSRVSNPGFIALLWGSPWRCTVRTVQNLVMTVVPLGRNAVGDWMWSGPSVTRLLTICGLLTFSVLLAVAFRRGDRAAVYGWVWAVAAFLPVCSLPWAERYAYLPAVGLALVAVEALNRVRGRQTARAKVVAAAILVVFALGSAISAYQWTRRAGRYAAPDQNRSSAAAQWKPAPKAVSRTRSPGLMRP
jgi:hypothetical protein